MLALGVGSQDCYDRAKALMREGSFERALDQLQLAREGLPEHAMLELRAAICLEELGRPEEARRHLEAARALRDGLARRADASGAGEALGELVELDRTLSRYWSMYGRPEPAHGPFLERAAAHVRAGRAAEALAEFAAAQELAPLGPRTLMNWGSAARAAGDAELAIDRYRAALALDPGHATTRLLLAAVLAERGRIEEARAAFEQARRLEPEHELVRALAPSLERPPR